MKCQEGIQAEGNEVSKGMEAEGNEVSKGIETEGNEVSPIIALDRLHNKEGEKLPSTEGLSFQNNLYIYTIHIHTHTHTHIYIYIHTHTHKHTLRWHVSWHVSRSNLSRESLATF